MQDTSSLTNRLAGCSWICVAMMATTCALQAHAQLQSTDIAGIALGSTPEQAEAVLRAHDSRFRYLKVYWRGPDGKPSNAVAVLKAAIQPDSFGIDSHSFGRPEQIAVFFTMTTGKTFAIYRRVLTPQGLPIVATQEQLARKYGPSTADGEGLRWLYTRATDATGKVSPYCSAFNFDWTVAPSGFSDGCGQSLRVSFDATKGPGVATVYSTWLYDHQALGADMKAVRAQREAANKEQIRQLQDSVQGNRAKL